MSESKPQEEAPKAPESTTPAGPEIHEISIHDMAHGGEGVGRLPDGRAVFVAGVIPGETVRVEIRRTKKKWARGRLLEVLEPSPDRVEALCPHFGTCGGCQWQHIELSRQRELKREVLVGQLRHLGKLQDPPVEETRAAGPADGFGYRNHATFAVDAAGRTAYHQAASRNLVPIDKCPLLHPLLQEAQEALPPMPGLERIELRVGVRTGQRLAMAAGECDEEPVMLAAERGVPLRGAGEGEITEMIGTERFRISSKSFFQVNTEGAELLVELVGEMLDPGEEDSVLDAFAGVGLFTVPLARRCRRVYAVERSKAALRDLRFHKGKLPIHIIGTAFEEAGAQMPPRVDLVVADPPREGLGETKAQTLAKMEPRRIILVSCDPASLARDARHLDELGYSLARVVPVDLFPQTFHVEAVARFERRG